MDDKHKIRSKIRSRYVLGFFLLGVSISLVGFLAGSKSLPAEGEGGAGLFLGLVSVLAPLVLSFVGFVVGSVVASNRVKG